MCLWMVNRNCTASVDTNARRVLHRLFFGSDVPELVVTEGELLRLAKTMVPRGRGWQWGQSVIEFGVIHCTTRKPLCESCPLSDLCTARATIWGALTSCTARGKGHLQGTKARTAPTADGSWPRSAKRPKRVSLFTSSVQYCTRIMAARTCPDSTASWKLGKRRARQDLSYGGSVMGGSRRTRSLRDRKAGRHTLRDHALKLALQAAITCLSPPPARSRALQS
jgi:hypothetical protein